MKQECDTIKNVLNNENILFQHLVIGVGSPHEVLTNALNCDIVLSDFELQLSYNVHLRTNTLGKGMNTRILLSY